MDQDDYEVVARDPISLADARAHNGFTKIAGQCYYCTKVFKNLSRLRYHQNLCRQKAKGTRAKEPGRRAPNTRQVVVDGGVISDDDEDIEPTPTPPQPALRSNASSSTELDMPAMKIKLQLSRDENEKLKFELSVEKARSSEIKDKYIQMLEQLLAT